MPYFIDDSAYIMHYGVKGMKWGQHLKQRVKNAKETYQATRGLRVRSMTKGALSGAIHAKYVDKGLSLNDPDMVQWHGVRYLHNLDRQRAQFEYDAEKANAKRQKLIAKDELVRADKYLQPYRNSRIAAQNIQRRMDGTIKFLDAAGYQVDTVSSRQVVEKGNSFVNAFLDGTDFMLTYRDGSYFFVNKKY